MQVTIYAANCAGNKQNCKYPNKCVVDNEVDFMAVIEKDHVTAKFTNFYRKNDNFEESDCIVMDNDNDHSENPDDWIGMQDFADAIPDCSVIIAPSKSHMKEKGGKPARPRFHAYFPTALITDKKQYELFVH